ncbi:MAG: hypothetical protein ACE5J9_06695, partial [Methanosarcinales archaeon]
MNQVKPINYKELSIKLGESIEHYDKSLSKSEKSFAYILVKQAEAKYGLNLLKQQIEKIDKLFEKKIKNKDYIKQLLKDLESSLERYEGYLAYLDSNEPEELDDMLGGRNVIELLIRELKNMGVEIPEYEERVKKADRIWKERIPERYLENLSAPPLAPEEFWWWYPKSYQKSKKVIKH